MLTEVSLDKALRFWKDGKEVIVLDRTIKSSAGGYETYSLDELFKNLSLLVDVPAVEDAEFQQAVIEMVKHDQEHEKPLEEEHHPIIAEPETDRLTDKKTKKEIALGMAEQGMNASQIAKQIDVKYSTVYSW